MRVTPRISGWIARAVFLVFCVVLMLGGVATLQRGEIHYSNYWGGAVFAPLAIAVGFLLMMLVLFAWQKFGKTAKTPKLKGKAARRARQAEETRFPIDEYKKW
jgi:hypothetical protein